MLPHVDIRPNGLIIPSDITEEQFREVGACLATIQRGLQWMWGDWLAFAEAGEKKKGLTASKLCIEDSALYELAETVSGLSYQTLRTAKSVCSRIQLFRRRNSLYFGHHAEVSTIEDEAIQDEWLDLAEKNNWSVSELRMAMRSARKTEPEAPGKDDGSLRSQLLQILDNAAGILKKEKPEDLPLATGKRSA